MAREFEARGRKTVLGGVAWERMVVDPHPGPRVLADIRGARALDGCAIVDPAAGATQLPRDPNRASRARSATR